MIFNEDAAHDCLADLGKLGVVQFTNLYPELTPFQRCYGSYVKNCNELERKLRFFGVECEKFNLEMDSAGDVEGFIESSTLSQESGAQILKTLEIELVQCEI